MPEFKKSKGFKMKGPQFFGSALKKYGKAPMKDYSVDKGSHDHPHSPVKDVDNRTDWKHVKDENPHTHKKGEGQSGWIEKRPNPKKSPAKHKTLVGEDRKKAKSLMTKGASRKGTTRRYGTDESLAYQKAAQKKWHTDKVNQHTHNADGSIKKDFRKEGKTGNESIIPKKSASTKDAGGKISKAKNVKSPAKHAVTSGAKDEYGESINPRKTLHTEVVDGHAHKKNTKPKNVKKK